MKTVFWGSLGLIVYTYAVYPCLLLALASFHQVMRDMRFAFRRGERRLRIPVELPTVSMVISAFNEEALIEEKMRNCAALCRSEEHTSELQSRQYLVCRLLLEKKKI